MGRTAGGGDGQGESLDRSKDASDVSRLDATVLTRLQECVYSLACLSFEVLRLKSAFRLRLVDFAVFVEIDAERSVGTARNSLT